MRLLKEEKITEMFKKKKEEKNEVSIVTGLGKISNDLRLLMEKLTELERENRQLRSSLFTANSDYKRLESISLREKEQAQNQTLKTVAGHFLPVIDDLSQAKVMLLNSGIDPAHIAPIEYIMGSLDKAFDAMGLISFEPLGEDFDPHTCQLGGKVKSEEFESDKICKVVRKGYKIAEEIIRPAIVLCSEKNNTGSDESK